MWEVHVRHFSYQALVDTMNALITKKMGSAIEAAHSNVWDTYSESAWLIFEGCSSANSPQGTPQGYSAWHTAHQICSVTLVARKVALHLIFTQKLVVLHTIQWMEAKQIKAHHPSKALQGEWLKLLRMKSTRAQSLIMEKPLLHAWVLPVSESGVGPSNR